MRLSAILPEPGPLRTLTTATLINTAGHGLTLSIAVIYYTRVVGLPAPQVGVAMSVAALVGLVAATPLGHLADRIGPRETAVAAVAASGLITFALLVVRGFWPLLLVLCAWALTESASHSARGAVIGELFSPEQRVRGRAYLRSVTNIGIMVGTAFAGIGLQLDTPAAYRWLVAGDAVSFLLTALILVRLPHVAPVPRQLGVPVLEALRDRPYLVVAVLNGVLAVHYGIFEVAVPLWVVEHTSAPRWTVAVLFVLNTIAVVFFQVRASRGTEATPLAARAMRASGLIVAAACLLYAAAAGRSAWLAVAVLTAAALVHVTGELLHAAGGFALSYNLAPEGRHGQYQGAFGMGFQLSRMAAPVLVTSLALVWGTVGWGILAAMFVLTGLAVPATVRWAERSRPAQPVPAV
jgi:MFS family permease